MSDDQNTTTPTPRSEIDDADALDAMDSLFDAIGGDAFLNRQRQREVDAVEAADIEPAETTVYSSAEPHTKHSTNAIVLDAFDRTQAKACEKLATYDAACGLGESTKAWSDNWADFFAAGYQIEPQLVNPTKLVTDVSRMRSAFLSSVMNTLEYAQSHDTAMLSSKMSAMFASSLSGSFQEFVDNSPKASSGSGTDSGDADSDGEDPQGKDAGAPPDEPDKSKKPPPPPSRSDSRRYAKKATQDMDFMDGCARAIGTEPGHIEDANARAIIDMARKTSQNSRIRKIVRMAGRYILLAEQLQTTKLDVGIEETTGVETGNDLSKIVPSEILSMAHPLLKSDFVKRFADEELMQYETKDRVLEMRGPIIVCVDESGSMTESINPDRTVPIVHAKGIALAMASIATMQRRSCLLVQFSTVCKSTFIPANATAEQRRKSLLQFVATEVTGGTNFTNPLNEALQHLDTNEGAQSDLIFITDGCGDLSPSVAQSVMEADCRTVGIGIVSGPTEIYMRSNLKPFCDVIYTLKELGLQQDAVRDILSI